MKFVLPVVGREFPASFTFVNGQRKLNTSMRSVARALITTGHLPVFTKPFDDYRAASLRMRVALGHAHLAVRADGAAAHLAPSPEWARLDPTEKAFASYFLGSAMAKLVVGRLLGCPLLLHLSMYQRALDIDFGDRQRPDFIGPMWGGEWIVVESKGRSRLGRSVLTEAKAQAGAVSMINGKAPLVCVASGTRFNKELVSVELLDPPADADGIALRLSTPAIVTTYYQPVIDLLGGSDQTIDVLGREVHAVRLRDLDLVSDWSPVWFGRCVR